MKAARRGGLRRFRPLRDDVPAGWLVASYFALMPACGEEVRAGRLDAKDAVSTLQRTLHGVFAPALIS